MNTKVLAVLFLASFLASSVFAVAPPVDRAIVSTFVTAPAATVCTSQYVSEHDRFTGATKVVLADVSDQLRADSLAAAQQVAQRSEPQTQGCIDVPISCGETIKNSLSTSSCVGNAGISYDIYDLDGQTGTAIDVVLTSSAFQPELGIFDTTASVPITVVTGTATRAELKMTLDSDGPWVIRASNTPTDLVLGAYTVALTCSAPSTGACTASDTTLCLGNGRFQVTATFNAGSGGSGNAHVVALTDDTGYLWFFASSNVEAVIKVLDGCGLGGHHWVFAGGLTNVKVVITVTDTQTKAVKTYTNPANTIFKAIQDTTAFATCP
jgi:hypothetical protein